ncbi:MAG: TatD family hydrolase [Victivallaceae bacterium]|nr:TatD family hydrolase [Victivallaceae bacterium]
MKLSTRKLGGVKFIDFHTHRRTVAPEALSVISLEPGDLENSVPESGGNNFFSVGMHPWRLPDSAGNIGDDLGKLRRALRKRGVIAVGEAGLDRLRGPDMEVQKAYLTGILKLAGELSMPVIIHCVRCYPELTFLKKRFASGFNLLVHGYNNNVRILEELLKHGFYVSFAPAALERDDICSYIRQKPEILYRAGLETDDSGLTIENIFARAARVFEMDVEELAQLMKNNFVTFFQVEDDA